MDWDNEVGEDEPKRPEDSGDSGPPPGWRPPAETIESISKPEPIGKKTQDTQSMQDIDEAEKLDSGMKALESTETGSPLAEGIKSKRTSLKFGETIGDANAQYDQVPNEITVHEKMRESTAEVLAPHLAHEGTHVKKFEPNSIDQEYEAFSNQAKVWDELKGNQVDRTNDSVSEIMKLSEAEARGIIRQSYPKLPEHHRK